MPTAELRGRLAEGGPRVPGLVALLRAHPERFALDVPCARGGEGWAWAQGAVEGSTEGKRHH